MARSGSVRMDPRKLAMAPLHELKAEGVWLFPNMRVVEVYLACFRVWLRRELQRSSKFADLRLSEDELDARVAAEEEHYLDMCRRLAFDMFERGVTSWTAADLERQQTVDLKLRLQSLFDGRGALACCPLRRSGGDRYSFLHKSLQDCFAALHLASQLSRRQPGQSLKVGELLIGAKFLTDDAAVLKFLAQLVDQRVEAYRRQGQEAVDVDIAAMQPLGSWLWELVYSSRRLQQQLEPVSEAKLSEDDQRLVRSAANAISVLVSAGVSMKGALAHLMCILIVWIIVALQGGF